MMHPLLAAGEVRETLVHQVEGGGKFGAVHPVGAAWIKQQLAITPS